MGDGAQGLVKTGPSLERTRESERRVGGPPRARLCLGATYHTPSGVEKIVSGRNLLRGREDKSRESDSAESCAH
jgi:hypothetical protein